MEQEKKPFSFLLVLAVIVVLAAGFYFVTRSGGKLPGFIGSTSGPENQPVTEHKNPYEGKTEPTVVKEDLKIPVTKKLTVTSGRTVDPMDGKVETPLVPKTPGETVIVPLATYTVKGAYGLALKEAKAWKSDAQLSFVKSLGAVTADGKSSQWQVAFASRASTKVSYEIIVQGDAIVSKKEVPAAIIGGQLPKTWIDSDEALKRLASLPQFANATISGINIFYNTDSKSWLYVFATSLGTTSLEL